MKTNAVWIMMLGLTLLVGCGKPPSAGGAPPEGDFPTDVVGAPVTVEALRQSVQLVGSFQAPDQLLVVAKVDGGVMSLPVEEGTFVKKGELLATIDDRKISARLKDAKARRDLAQATLDRAEGLRKTNSISVQEFDEARAELDRATATIALLQAEFDDTKVKAMMDGVLTEHIVSVGQVVPVGQELMTLVQLDPLEISFEVPERFLAAVEAGLAVNIRTDAYGGEVFNGELVYLAPRLSTTTRTLPVKASVPNPDGKLRPGMFGKVELVLREIPDALFVPETAVMQQGTQSMVVVRNAESFRSEFRPVQVGVRQGGRMQVLDGLSAGELVVAEGTIKMFYPGMLLNFTEDSRRYGLEPSMAPMPEPPPAAEGE